MPFCGPSFYSTAVSEPRMGQRKRVQKGSAPGEPREWQDPEASSTLHGGLGV